MGLTQKIRKYGIAGSIKRAPGAVRYRVDNTLYRREYARFQRLPIDERLIVLESEGDLSDNAYALYDHMREAGYLDRYRVVWAVDDLDAALRLKEADPGRWPNTEFVRKFPSGVRYGGVNRDCARALATCRWFVYDHNNLMARLPKREGQEVVFLSHGCGYKGPKGARPSDDVTPYDHMTVTGPLAATCVSNWQQRPEELAVITGYPRNDYLFQVNPVVSRKVAEWIHPERYRKVIFWMPTFRQSAAADLSEDYLTSETGLPLFDTSRDLGGFSEFLREQNILLVFKLHHLQADLPVFRHEYPNVLLVRDGDLRDRGIQLYQFLNVADALISDYSSISVDYMLLDRPIVYTLDDYEEYAQSRGLFPENAIDYMPGYHVYDVEGLERALREIADGEDVHKEDRAAIVPRYHTYRDGNSAERVLEAIGID